MRGFIGLKTVVGLDLGLRGGPPSKAAAGQNRPDFC